MILEDLVDTEEAKLAIAEASTFNPFVDYHASLMELIDYYSKSKAGEDRILFKEAIERVVWDMLDYGISNKTIYTYVSAFENNLKEVTLRDRDDNKKR